jgi:hypothetical protein
MNQTQKKYAIERINTILHRKLADVKQRFITKGKKLTYEERLQLIRSKKVWLKTEKALIGKRSYDLNDIDDVFDFSKYEYASTLDQNGYDKIADKIEKKATLIKDHIMIGSASEALKMIEDFQDFSGD